VRRLTAIPLLLLVALPGGSAELDVQARDGLLTLRARAVPLVDVLERLSRETGLKLVYEGPKPSQLVTVTFEGLPETEALGRLFEGLGIDYAFHSDASGQHVGMLIVSRGSGTGASAAASRAPSPPRRFGNVPPGSAPVEEPFAPEPDAGQAEPPEAVSPEAEGGEEPAYLPLTPWEGGAGAPPGSLTPGGAPVSSQPPGPASSPFPTYPGQQPGQVPGPVFPGPASVPLPPPSFPYQASTPG